MYRRISWSQYDQQSSSNSRACEQPSEIQAIPAIVTIGEQTPAGNFFLTFSINIGGEIYTQVVTVVVE